jgi:hypothetical protein
MLEALICWLEVAWCRTFHRSISRPRHGKYFCWRCMLEFPVDW